MLSTIKVLSQIEQDIKKQKSLEGYLPSLISSLQSSKKVVLVNMNGKQKLSQLQALIEGEMKNIDKKLAEMNVNLQEIDDEEEVDVEEEQQEIDDEEQQQFDEEMIDEEGEQQDDESEMEVEENDENEEQEEFLQPQFGNNIAGQEGQEQQQQQMLDEQQQQGEGQYEEQEGDNEQGEQDQQQNEEDEFNSQDDVGLYGEELNENDEDFEAYENEFDDEEFKQFQQEFGEKQPKSSKKDKKKKSKNQEESQNPDEHIEDNFDHFRQVQMENQKQQQETKPQPKTDLDDQIDRLEGKITGKRDWVMKGQIKARQRPANSLLEYDLQFNSGVKYSHEITEERNTELEELIKKRILNDMFDDRTRFVNTNHIREHFGSLKEVSREKSQMGLGELYQSQFKNFLGIGENKNDKLKSEIMDSFKELNYFLDSLSNFSFVPKPTKENTKKGQSEAIIVEQKVPLTLWNGQREVQKDGKMTFESQKEVDNQAKRLKNKRIARQRKKQQMKKKLNKAIEYGGITKFEAQAKKKAQMNNKPLKIDGVNMKYNKSSSFFKNINESKGGKPNPDISKMKI